MVKSQRPVPNSDWLMRSKALLLLVRWVGDFITPQFVWIHPYFRKVLSDFFASSGCGQIDYGKDDR
jgi:hypothetical protein